MISRRRFLGSAAAAAVASPPRCPNIVLMMADDMGYSDLGCYGGEIATPHLDRLARQGIRFTHFHNTARCCPTRASLLTGLYPHQTGIGHMVDNPKPFPGYTGDLNRQCVTIAEVLRPAGYRTCMSGKWHVTPVTDSRHNWPLQRGFDKFHGTIHGAGSFYDPATLTLGNQPVEPEGRDYNYTDAIAGYASGCIREHGRGADPFFLYVAFTAPHWPLHASEADIGKYRGRYKDGWDALREERHRRMIGMGLVDKRWPLTPRDARVPAWKDAPHRAWQERRMEVYAAQIDRMDQGIGRILAALKETGAERNTLVLFLADNGGCAEELRPGAAARHIPKATRDGRPVKSGNDPALMPGPDDTYQSYGIGWANASNTPFRLYKHWVHEGGISTPLIAAWPGGVSRPGSITHQRGHLIDLMATCADLGGAKYPGAPITPLEGQSLKPVLEGRQRAGHSEIFWEHEGNRAVVQERWKLVSRHPGEWELYDLEADRSEVNDLAARHPDRVRQLAGKYDAWAARAGVEPWDKVMKAPPGQS